MKKKNGRKVDKKKKERTKKESKERKENNETCVLHPARIPPCPPLNKRASDSSKHHPPFPPRKKQGNLVKDVIIQKRISSKLRGHWFTW